MAIVHVAHVCSKPLEVLAFFTYSSVSDSRCGGDDVVRLMTCRAQPHSTGRSFKSLNQNAEVVNQ